MQYEYKIDYYKFIKDGLDENIPDVDLCDWLNKQGQKGWRLIHSGYSSAIFERKIEINQKLRKLQLESSENKEEESNNDRKKK